MFNKGLIKNEKNNTHKIDNAEYVSFKKTTLYNIHCLCLVLGFAFNVACWWKGSPIITFVQSDINISLITGIGIGALIVVFAITGAYKD